MNHKDFHYGLDPVDLKKVIEVICANSNVLDVILFGSRAKGNYKAGSDIDLALVTTQPLTLSELNSIKVKLDDLLLPYKIDLIELGKLTNLELIEHIKRVGVKLGVE